MQYRPHPRRAVITGSRYAAVVPAGAIWAMREAPGHKRSPLHNPHAVGDEGPKPIRCRVPACDGAVHTRGEAVALYAERLAAHPEIVALAAEEAPGALFACRCPLTLRCHVDVLLGRVDGLRAAA